MSDHRPAGSRAVAVGSALLFLSIGIALVGSMLTVGRLEGSSALTRDVVIEGQRQIDLPGKLSFEVAEPLSEKAPRNLHIGVLINSAATDHPRCTLHVREGDQIPLTIAPSNAGLYVPNDPTMVPIASARLEPGRYEVTCEMPGSGSGAAERFTVGRVIGMSDLTSGELSPVLWFAAVLFVAGLFFLAGGITLVVGLVKRGKARRADQFR